MATHFQAPQEPQPDERQTSQDVLPAGSDELKPGGRASDEPAIERTLATGSRRFVSLDEWNRPYREADALLDEKTRRKHPEVSLADEAFRQQYRDLWVAIAITEVDNDDRVAKGRLFATARDHRSLFRRIRALRKKYPQLVFSDEFVGHRTGRGFITGISIA